MALIKDIRLDDPNHRIIDDTVRTLENNGIICYPTDTIYGLGADLMSKKAMKKVTAIKKKTMLPMSFICSDFAMISEYTLVSNHAFKIMRRVLPGPYTFVLPTAKRVPDLLLYKRKTVGIRMPDCSFCLDVVSQLGRPILSTSIPSDSDEVLNDVYEIDQRYGNQLDLIIDGGRLYSEPSTVVSLVNDDLEILREGKGNINLLY